MKEHAFLKRKTPPEDYKRADAAFWKWKQSLSETWRMVEASQLPSKESEIHTLRWLLEHDKGTNTVDSLRAAWLSLSPNLRRDLWPDLMNSTLRSCPAHAPVIFTATFDAALVPAYLAQDTLLHLARLLVEFPSADASVIQPTAEELYGLLQLVFENSPAKYLQLRQVAIFYLIQLMKTPEGVHALYRLLIQHDHRLHKYTRLQFASHLAGVAKLKKAAVEVLQNALATTDLDINTPQGAALCTTILSTDENEKPAATATDAEGTLTPAEMFEQLLRCGLEPNLITYTTIIRGLCLRGELEAAQQVLRLMIKTQTVPDEYVYSTLLNGAKLHGDFSIIRHVAETAAAQEIWHPIVWNDFLQAIYLTAFDEARRDRTVKRPRVVPSFPLMLQAYAKLFPLEPLRCILPVATAVEDSSHDDGARPLSTISKAHGSWEFAEQLIPTVHALPQLARNKLIQPTSSTLTTMILGYIQGVSNPYDVIAFYSNFRRLLQSGDPVATDLVHGQGTLVHDVVVMSLCEFEGMLRVALDVVGDMLRDATTEVEQQQQENSHHHPPPSVYTWSILLNGFMFYRQTKQGERILRMMRERGVEPNIVSWNTLMAGYARLQNVKKTANAFQRLERAGFEPDEFTFRAFSYLSDKSAILNHLERRKVATAARGGPNTGDEYEMNRSSRSAKYERRSLPTTYDVQSSLDLDQGFTRENNWRSGNANADARKLRQLESEVEEIAKMMDEEQQEGIVMKSGSGTA